MRPIIHMTSEIQVSGDTNWVQNPFRFKVEGLQPFTSYVIYPQYFLIVKKNCDLVFLVRQTRDETPKFFISLMKDYGVDDNLTTHIEFYRPIDILVETDANGNSHDFLLVGANQIDTTKTASFTVIVWGEIIK